jgi:hypothetical protein
MAASSAVIANRALFHLGVAGVITNLDTDVTIAGKACRQFYAPAVRDTLEAHDWRCALKQSSLTLVETFASSETREWLYAYRLPEDCLVPRRIVWGVRMPAAEQEYPFDTRADTASTDWSSATAYTVGQYARLASSGVWYRCIAATTNNTPPNGTYWAATSTAHGGPPKLLVTDRASAILEYTMDLTDPTRFDSALTEAIAARLAYMIAPNVTVNGSADALQNRVLGLWQATVSAAVTQDFVSRQRDVPQTSGYQLARFRGVR